MASLSPCNQGWSAYVIEGSAELSQQVNQIVTKYLLLSSAIETFPGSLYKNQFAIAQFHLQKKLLKFMHYCKVKAQNIRSRDRNRSDLKKEKMIIITRKVIDAFPLRPPYNCRKDL